MMVGFIGFKNNEKKEWGLRFVSSSLAEITTFTLMAGYRESFIKISNALSRRLSTSSLLRWTRQDTLLPFYHAISDDPLPHIQHLYLVKNSQQFRKDLDQLLKVFDPIDLLAFKKLQKENKPPKKPIFHLSFDDGLSQFHDVIAPILLEKGIAASCFLNSKFVDNRDLFFRYKASLLIEQLNKKPKLENDPGVMAWRDNFDATLSLRQIILNCRYHDREQLDTLAGLIGLDFSEFLKIQKPYLSSVQIKKLIDQGFHFGAHSVDHPEYRFLDLSTQIEQTKNSVDWVCNTFELNYRAFSFPFTDYQVSQAFFDRLAQEGIAELTFGGAGQKQENIPFHFQRMPLEVENLEARQIINSELLYYLIKAPFGKNRIQRQ